MLYDTVYRATGATSKFPGVKPGTRASALPDSGVELPSGFLATFGRPPRESACECERSSGLQLGPVMALISGPTIAEAIEDPNNELAKLTATEKDDHRLINEVFLRILNRPATSGEIEATLAAIKDIKGDHEQLSGAFKGRDTEMAPIRAKQEADRTAEVAKTQTALTAYEKELAPRLAAAEKKRVANIAALDADLKKYDAESLPKAQAAWESQQSGAVVWTPLNPTKLVSSVKSLTLAKQDDLSIVASGKPGLNAIYTITADTELYGITAVRIEALPDPKLPGGGPGLGGGNFVLTEFEVKAAPRSEPVKALAVPLRRPLADFSQDNFDVRLATDGVIVDKKGWAISPAIGQVHWATFETKQAIAHEGGSQLTFTLQHRLDKDLVLGRFRISVTTAARPVGLSLAEDLRRLLALDDADRKPEQKTQLAKYYRTRDPGLRQRETSLATAKQPLPIDPKLKEIKDRLELVSQPVKEDPKLAQLRADLEMSTKQLGNARLTGVQDLAWALINSPAFLFNH